MLLLKISARSRENNPEIDVTKLAEALHTYSESQKIKEHDESFNVKDGSIPQDSDSGISTDGELVMLKEENLSLTHVRRDYDDVCERLCSSEAALDDAKRVGNN
ncbi:hypothetical protein EVAR_97831_1 [Eumeta japonica]|uniref:Uncharacterized protein n=1 Tax=Eumeta variegata TaxID=151549 RepID=A0A4C1SJD6_EUMVA|nr:hypothetical protein EVAR_97831_1 [Eumeta japonica]